MIFNLCKKSPDTLDIKTQSALQKEELRDPKYNHETLRNS